MKNATKVSSNDGPWVCVRAPFVDASISEQIRKIVWWLPTVVL